MDICARTLIYIRNNCVIKLNIAPYSETNTALNLNSRVGLPE